MRMKIRALTKEDKTVLRGIQSRVARYFDLSPTELKNRRDRRECIAWPRQIAMVLCYEYTQSNKCVASVFPGYSSHTVLHARQVVQNRCDTEQAAREVVGRLRNISDDQKM